MQLYLLLVLAHLTTVLAQARLVSYNFVWLEPGNARRFAKKLEEAMDQIPDAYKPHANE